jgi:hypothetical protein
MFSGYAGTSASGFAAEVATEEAVARLDYAEDIYRYWNDGGRSQGGASARIDAEFARIRRELGDLPGVVSSPTRLRRMQLAKTLYPGILNDCFHQSATAVCRKQAKALGARRGGVCQPGPGPGPAQRQTGGRQSPPGRATGAGGSGSDPDR